MSTEATETYGKKPASPQGAPVWIEICSHEPTKLKEFYAALFPAWSFGNVSEGEGFQVVHYKFQGPSGLTGGIVKLPKSCAIGAQPMGAGYTVYYSVKSIDEIEGQIIELGGKKVLDKMAEGKNGWFANFKDPEGNRFGVYEANYGSCESA